MHYWNKDNFEGLLELARELEKVHELTALAEYCNLRQKGLRAQSFAKLSDFLNEATLWNIDRARRNVLTILQAQAQIPAAHQFVSHPLLTRLIYPTLEQWKLDEPSAIEPLRWLGLLRSDRDALSRALALAPGDIASRRRLISLALADADYATHHLSESVLLLSVEEARAAIATVKQLLASAPDIQQFTDLEAEAAADEQMIDDWVAYRQSPVGTFPQWCDARGRTYAWPTIVYYDDDPDQPDHAANTAGQ